MASRRLNLRELKMLRGRRNMTEFPKIQKDQHQDEQEGAESLIFSVWLDSIKRGPKRRNYKIPSKIVELPCGCKRDRGQEVDISNIWHVAMNASGNYFHTQCKKEFDIK